MHAIFLNTSEPACGVHQFGENLFEVLRHSQKINWSYLSGTQAPMVRHLRHFDVVVYNWQGLIGGWMSTAPLEGLKRQVLVYHDLSVQEEKWDAILFSDPTMASHGKWHSIGRPITPMASVFLPPLKFTEPIVGVHGFVGAWADQVVTRVCAEFEFATVRLHLPYSPFCDPTGAQAVGMAARCRAIAAPHPGIMIDVSHAFFSHPKMLEWLSQNTINCYFRDPAMNWRGVSSAPDAAMAARRPLAVNACNAFRHIYTAVPSVLIEHNSIMDIIRRGLSPLMPLYQRWSPEVVRQQVEDVLFAL